MRHVLSHLFIDTVDTQIDKCIEFSFFQNSNFFHSDDFFSSRFDINIYSGGDFY